MYIKDGIVYAENPQPIIKAVSVRALNNHKLWVRFCNGETREVDIEPLLSKPVYMPLKEKKVFDDVYLDYGAPTWNDGQIDIAPEYLLYN